MSHFRVLDINGRMPDVSAADTSHEANDRPSKPCVKQACSGTMYLHKPMEEAPSPTHLEFPRAAAWVCANDAAHIEIVSLEEYSRERRDFEMNRLASRPKAQRL